MLLCNKFLGNLSFSYLKVWYSRRYLLGRTNTSLSAMMKLRVTEDMYRSTYYSLKRSLTGSKNILLQKKNSSNLMDVAKRMNSITTSSQNLTWRCIVK